MREKAFAILLNAFILVLFLGWVDPAHGQPSAQDGSTTCSAAMEDARRQLVKRINDLQFGPDAYVRDFTAESDEITTALDSFVKRAGVVETHQLDDGLCEVTIQLTVEQIERELQRIVKEHYHGDRWGEHSFDEVPSYYTQEVLTVTGISAHGPAEPEWASQYIRATGSGVPPEDVKDTSQAKLLAERAAETDAKRNLLEKISGIQVDPTTYVRDYVTEHDEVTTRLNAFLANSKKVDTRYLDDGVVEVDLEAPLSGVWGILKSYRK